jgi:hypothetical protein
MVAPLGRLVLFQGVPGSGSCEQPRRTETEDDKRHDVDHEETNQPDDGVEPGYRGITMLTQVPARPTPAP